METFGSYNSGMENILDSEREVGKLLGTQHHN